MRIGVLSDTHMRSYREIPKEIVKAFSKVELIVHAGDFTTLEVLEDLRQLSEVKAVRGNMDSAELRSMLPQKELILVEDRRLGIVHGSGGPVGIESRVREWFDQIDVIVYGHTHEPQNEVIGGILFFNPGQARSSFGILTIEEDIRGEIINIVY